MEANQMVQTIQAQLIIWHGQLILANSKKQVLIEYRNQPHLNTKQGKVCYSDKFASGMLAIQIPTVYGKM